MNEQREQLINRMIKLYGHENEIVIGFASMCERFDATEDNDKLLTVLVEAHEADPVIEENDE